MDNGATTEGKRMSEIEQIVVKWGPKTKAVELCTKGHFCVPAPRPFGGVLHPFFEPKRTQFQSKSIHKATKPTTNQDRKSTEVDVKRAPKVSRNRSKIYEKHTYKMTSKKVGKIMESNESLKGLTTPKCRKGHQFLCFAEGACGREGRTCRAFQKHRKWR